MSNWNAGHTPYHYPVPLPSPTPGTQHYSPPPSEQWPAVSARPPSILSLESRSFYGTAPFHAPSLPSVVGRACTPPLADYFEDVYSPGVPASLGMSDSYRSQSFDGAASGYTSGVGSGYSRAPRPREFVSPPPILSETSYRPLCDSSAQRFARGRPPALSCGSAALMPVQRPKYNFNPVPYHPIMPHAMLPTLPPLAPGASDVMVYARCNGGPGPDVEIRAGGSETVVRIKHRLHHEERRGHRRHRPRP